MRPDVSVARWRWGASPIGVAAIVHSPVEIKQPRIREVRGEREAHRIKGVRRARLSDSGNRRRKAIERGGADERRMKELKR